MACHLGLPAGWAPDYRGESWSVSRLHSCAASHLFFTLCDWLDRPIRIVSVEILFLLLYSLGLNINFLE